MKMNAKYKGYCGKCHFTIWVNEKIEFDGQAKHLDCVTAIKDETPRVCDPRHLSTMGKINQKKLKDLMDSGYGGAPAPPPAAGAASDRIHMKSKYDGTCCHCHNKIHKDAPIVWCPDSKNSWHEKCKDKPARKKKKSKAKKKSGYVAPASRPARGSVRFVSGTLA